MKTKITYSPPFQHSCQNVPSSAINTTRVQSVATARREVHFDVGSGGDIGTDPHFNNTEVKIHFEVGCNTNTRGASNDNSDGNNICSNCCQREHTNYGKHAMLKCPTDAVVVTERTGGDSNDCNERSSKKSREWRKLHHCLHGCYTKSETVAAGGAGVGRAGAEVETEAQAGASLQSNANPSSSNATIMTGATLEATTKLSLQIGDDKEASVCRQSESLLVEDVSSASTDAMSSASPSACGHIHSHSHTHLHSHSHAHLHSHSYLQSHSITLKTQSCLADSLRLRNRRQLVMPIVENSLGNTVAMQQQHKQQQQQQQKAAFLGGRPLRCDAAVLASPISKATAMAEPMLGLGQLTPTPAAQQQVGSVESAEMRALTEGADDAIDNSQTTTTIKANTQQTTTTTTTGTTENETFECRCFEGNGDICMAGEQQKPAAEQIDVLAEDNCAARLCHNTGVTTTRDLPERTATTLQRLNCLPAASMTTTNTYTTTSATTTEPTLTPTSTLTLKQIPTLPLFLEKHLVTLDMTSASVWRRSKLLLLVLCVLMLSSTANCWAGRQDVPSNCTFPSQWQGSWFLSGYQQSIHIKGSQFSYRGRCAASDGNKYLIVDEKGCHRCLVIYEKHKNVLQYKESECEGDSMYMHQTNPSAMAMRSVLKQNDHRGGAHPNLNNNNGHSRLSSSDQYIMRSNDDMNDYFCKGRETLQNLCDQIPGDALLYSLFRESAEPVKCPLKGPFIFTYNRGHGECKSPVSNIESCTEDSRLLLSFQACPDVQGTESTVEELTCLATWKDGNSRYLVGLVSHHHAISNEERYRCFVYEKISSLMGGPSLLSSKDAEYKLAQSGDATCNGLDSAEVGSRIMSLRKPPLTERCDFPTWFKGPRHWHVLMGNAVYNYHPNDGSVHIIKPNGFMETRALCEQINKQTSTEMMAVVHYTTGCQSGFMCMMFYRRDTHVIEIQTGKQASRLEDACAPDHFDVNRMAYITLLASNPDPQICPMEGLYNLRGAIGPPYSTTRHKRNHNNKIHMGHGHHHLQSELPVTSVGSSGGNANSGYTAHKRHSTLSFRNSDKMERGAWHANTRGLPIRSRRATANTFLNNGSQNSIAADTHITLIKEQEHTTQLNPVEIAVDSARRSDDSIAVNNTTISVEFIKNANKDVGHLQQRNRRDAPGCVTNFKAQRRLWVGCTEPDVIDVRPLCSDNGDEEYYCHGSWAENGTIYIIARHTGTKHGVCISYRPTEGTAAKLVIGDACYRGTLKPPEHHLVANLTVFGKCGETGSDATHVRANNWLVVILAVASLVALTSAWHANTAMSAMHAPVIKSR